VVEPPLWAREVVLPNKFALFPVYPNPARSFATIQFHIPYYKEDGVPVQVVIYDIRGRKIKTLLHENKNPGRYMIVWDGTGESNRPVASGKYIYRLISNDILLTRTITFRR
jgi:hypothetical protein